MVAASGALAVVGDEGTKFEDERRGASLWGAVGVSLPRSDEVEPFLASAGDDVRSMLNALGLRLGAFGGGLCVAGDDAVRAWSDIRRGEYMPGEDGRGVFAAVLIESRFNE